MRISVLPTGSKEKWLIKFFGFRFSGEKGECSERQRAALGLGGTPKWYPDENGRFNNDYFCGDLKGIEEKLEYL